LTGQNWGLSGLKNIWPVIRTGDLLSVILSPDTEKIFNLGNGFSIQECTQVGDSVMKFFSILFLILIFHVCQNGWKKEKKTLFFGGALFVLTRSEVLWISILN